ncbi:unnamed protein product [Trichobilharzia regenti]|nr:unnamed protein product [Trichobilharzia regenti]
MATSALNSSYLLNSLRSLQQCVYNNNISSLCLIIQIRSDSGSSQRWLARQRSDPYVKRARIESYRCRSAFKLLQLNDKIHGGLFKPGDIVVDCGAAPGSWCQVASSFVNPSLVGNHSGGGGGSEEDKQNSGLVIAFDLLPFADLPGVISYPGTDLNNWSECVNLINQSVLNHLTNNRLHRHSGRKDPLPAVDIILSDIAPNVSGMRDIDIPAMMKLALNVLRVSLCRIFFF